MTEPSSSADGAPDVAGRHEQLGQRIRDLETELSALRASLSTGITTRRVAVVEDDGFERVVLEARDHFGSIAVRARSTGAGSGDVELFCNDPLDGDGAHVGIALVDRGNVVAAFEVLQGRSAVFWVDDDQA